jgi:hypothetical protein
VTWSTALLASTIASGATIQKSSLVLAMEEGDNGSDNKNVSPQTDKEASEVSDSDIPLLPMGDPDDGSIPRIQLGDTIRFEELGPIIINADGTTRRIENWQELSEREKQVTWRRISQRNEQRRKVLLEQQRQDEDKSDQGKNNSEL